VSIAYKSLSTTYTPPPPINLACRFFPILPPRFSLSLTRKGSSWESEKSPGVHPSNPYLFIATRSPYASSPVWRPRGTRSYFAYKALWSSSFWRLPCPHRAWPFRPLCALEGPDFEGNASHIIACLSGRIFRLHENILGGGGI